MVQEVLHTFDKGQQADLDDHLKNKQSYILGEHGRLFAEDGTLSFVSIEGTQQIYANDQIVKYLGACSFKDQIILFVKCSGVDVNIGGVIYETVEIDVVFADNFTIDLNAGVFSITNELSTNSRVTSYTENVANPAPPLEVDLDDNYAPDDGSDAPIDYSTYYDINVNVPVFGTCPVTAQSIPPNNNNFADCIISLQKDDQGNFFEKIIWSGYQNWPIDGKIVCLGIDENSNYRRVKYTDFVNPFRTINVYDPNLFKRTTEELNNFQSTILLQPRINSINETGQLKSMTALYLYRLITENGQVTEFSPISEPVYIVPDTGSDYRGGSPGEVTNKSVAIDCNIADPQNFFEIECVALEFEAATVPSSIKSLGIKPVASTVSFNHFGSESEFSENITLADIVEIRTQWKYCSDLESYNNKLIASGLRNDPITSQFNELKNNFALHGWTSSGQTHTTFINPDPVLYNMIPPEYTDKLFYANKRVYRSIRIFQSSQVTFINTSTGNSYSTTIGNTQQEYRDYTEEISTWLLDRQANEVDFTAWFPNLTIEYTANVILLKPTDDGIETDMSEYEIQFDNTQVIVDLDDENIFFNATPGGLTYVNGALSAGFNSGTGIRITYRMVEDELATQATSRYNGTGPILNFENPSFKRTFVKDEIYRLFLQLYKEGERLFAIPLGDIWIPALGTPYSYIDDAGNIVISSDQYANQKTVGNKLYGVRVELRVEFRMACKFTQEIDMFQLLYVERDENNRHVLCQGISAPLIRLQDPVDFLAGVALDEKLQRKWLIPYHGGPTYDKVGLDIYDANGGEYEEATYDHEKRTIHDRSLFYFDSPDIIYGNISDQFVASSELKVVGRLNTDHNSDTVMISGESGMGANPQESYPKFSRKILIPQLNTLADINDWPKLAGDENADDDTYVSHFVNVSVFSNYTFFNDTKPIEGAISLLRGEVIPGSELNTGFELSNNTFCLPCMPWWFSEEVRRMRKEDDQYGFEALPRSNISFGERTMFIRSDGDLFTDSFIGPQTLDVVSSQIRRGVNSYITYDSHALINIKRNNVSSIYGGRSEQAYSKNVAVPLSETIPTYQESNAAQVFNVQGDAYVTLFIRTKNSYGDNETGQLSREINNGRTDTAPNRGDIQTSYRLNGAHAYAAVIETMVEPKLNYEYEFYRETSGIDFSIVKNETINSAYTQRNNLRRFIPQPFRFNDDPDLLNDVAVSEVKLNGEYYDAWSSFLPNEFYSLDRNKGGVLNLAKERDRLFAIQEHQTSLLYIDRSELIPTASGDAINVRQGSGNSITDHEIVSRYGTGIRRALVKSTDFGFMFVDEQKKVLVKINEEKTLQMQFHHDFYKKYTADPIVNVEPFFDEKYKESGITIFGQSGDINTITYSEVLEAINGFWPLYKAPLYINFQDELYAPIENSVVIGPDTFPDSEFLHKLNQGDHLNIFGNQGSLSIEFICAPKLNETFVFPALSLILNDDQPFTSIQATTKEGLNRVILPTHNRYSVKEGVHSLPLLNYWQDGIDNDELKKLRSEFVKFKITLPYNGNVRKITAATAHVRKSYN